MTLRTWIDKLGPKKVAQLLTVDNSTVYKWRKGKITPRPKEMLLIHKHSKKKVSYKSMIETAAKNS